MKRFGTLILVLFLIHGNIDSQSVGINNPSPDTNAVLDIKSTTKGILIPRLKTVQRQGMTSPPLGLLAFDINTNSFWYYDGTSWIEFGEGIFKHENGVVYGPSTADDKAFIFGGNALPAGIGPDTAFFFDGSKGAFRAGINSGTAWQPGQIGDGSMSLGEGNRASGEHSVALGLGALATGHEAISMGSGTNASGTAAMASGFSTVASGLNATATGRNTVASGSYSFAGGNLSEASGASAVAMGSDALANKTAAISLGIQTQATGLYSTALGRTTTANARTSMAIGRFNVGGGSETVWQESDPLFEVGNGSDASNLNNALTILKDGKTGIGTATPDTNFSVIGVSRAALDESETDYIEMSHGGNNAFINKAGAGNIDIRHEDQNIMTLTSAKNVGIGTNSPDTKLSVIGKVRGAYQGNENEYTEIFHGGGNGFINTVGDGNLEFRHDNNTVMSLTDDGDLSLNGALSLGINTASAEAGMIRYNSGTNEFEGHNGSQWKNLGEDGDGDANNELQTLFLSGNQIGITNGNLINLPSVSGGAFIESSDGMQAIRADLTSVYGGYIGIDLDGVEYFTFDNINASPSLGFNNNNGNISISSGQPPNNSNGVSNITLTNQNNQLFSVSGDSNIVVGINTDASVTGTKNIIIGTTAGAGSGSKNRNVIIGMAAGQALAGNSIVAIGRLAGNGAGGNSTYIGHSAQPNNGGYINGGAFGHLSLNLASSEYMIGNVQTDQIGGYEPWSNVSDGRFKINVEENVPGLDFINALRPVTYQVDQEELEKFIRGREGFQDLDPEYKAGLNDHASYKTETGFIAQEVEAAAAQLGYDFDGIQKPKNEQDPYALAYATFVVPLVKAVQELTDQNEQLVDQVNNQQQIIDDLHLRIVTLENK